VTIEEQSLASKTLQFFCRHLVGLCVIYEIKNDETGKQHFAAFSGTLIIIAGQVHFLTAGHVLKVVDELRNNAMVEINRAVLADIFGGDKISDQPIPFVLTDARFFYIDNEEDGLDFGVMALDPYYVRLLAKNGVVALEEQNWIHQPKLNFDGYIMLGLPDEFASKTVLETGDAQVSPTMFPVTRLAAPPPDRKPTRYAQFVGQIDARIEIKSIVGMSGGPIFGFKFEPSGTRYWIVAIQSSWLPDSRIVFACPLPTFASMMVEWAEEHEASDSVPH
jgi:hypothetical protein